MSAGFHMVWAAALLGSLATAGCVIGAAEAEPAPVAAAKRVDVAQVSADAGSAADVDLGSDGDRTCFLLGVRGSLAGSRGNAAFAGVVREGGRYLARARAGAGSGVSATVACIPDTDHRAELVAASGRASTAVAATPGRQCFLASVAAEGRGWGAELQAFPFGAPGVKLETEHGAIALRGWLGDAAGAASASAVCVDIAAQGAREAHEIGGAGGGAFANDAGWACGLDGVFGVFDGHGGAELAAGERGWSLSLGERREAYVKCVK